MHPWAPGIAICFKIKNPGVDYSRKQNVAWCQLISMYIVLLQYISRRAVHSRTDSIYQNDLSEKHLKRCELWIDVYHSFYLKSSPLAKSLKTKSAFLHSARYTKEIKTAKTSAMWMTKVRLHRTSSRNVLLEETFVFYPLIFGKSFAPPVLAVITTTSSAHIRRVPCQRGAASAAEKAYQVNNEAVH